MESLERRELLAANLLADPGLLLSVDEPRSFRPAASGTLTPGGGGSGSGGTTANFLLGDILSQTMGTFQQVDPPPPVLGATFENGVLTVTGSHDADNLLIYASEGTLYVREVVKELTLFSMPYAEPISRIDNPVAGNGPALLSIVVNANGGDDWVNVDDLSISIPTTLRGDWGNDTLLGGAGPDDLFGGSGNDELAGRAGADDIHGDHGDDLLVAGTGNDFVHGGYGNDYILGGTGNDWLLGEEGDDKMFGEAGNDMMFGGPGQNVMDGGTGDDQLYGGDDNDAMYGGEGNDFIRAFAGDDRLRGEGGNDDLNGDDGSDVADGGDGDDYITGDAGNDALSGGDGNDAIDGGNDQDWLDGGDGNDALGGGAGNDWVSGGAGTDEVDGGSGSNQVYQSYPEDYLQYGVYTSELSFGDVGDFFVDVWDGIVGVFKWTLDKAESIGLRVWDWATNIDDRLFRLVEDLGDALSNWPWEADFWKGLGRVLIDALEIVGLGEAWEIAFEILKPWQRGLTSEEIAVARGVFGDSIHYNRVRLDEHSLMAWIGRTHVTGYLINSTEDLDDSTLIHELTHVWQYEEFGLVYIPEAIDGQNSDEGYSYGGVAGLQAKIAANQGLSAFNPEQQGAIVADYFDLRQDAREEEATSGYASDALRDQLDVYIHFVKEVSTLTPGQLDSPDPPRFPTNIFDATIVTTATASPGTPAGSVVGVNPNTVLDLAFDQFLSPPNKKSPTMSEPGDAAISGNERFSPVTTRALDLALESLP
jgi:Ca2+-binding RTX toxin-like protein